MSGSGYVSSPKRKRKETPAQIEAKKNEPNEVMIRAIGLELMDKLSESFGEVSEDDQKQLEFLLENYENPVAILFYAQEKARVEFEECKELELIYKIRAGQHKKKRESFKKRIKTLLEMMQDLGNEGKAKGPWGTAYLSNRKSLIIDDESEIPSHYFKSKETFVLDKKELRKDIEEGKTWSGEAIDGAHLEMTQNLTIRSK